MSIYCMCINKFSLVTQELTTFVHCARDFSTVWQDNHTHSVRDRGTTPNDDHSKMLHMIHLEADFKRRMGTSNV